MILWFELQPEPDTVFYLCKNVLRVWEVFATSALRLGALCHTGCTIIHSSVFSCSQFYKMECWVFLAIPRHVKVSQERRFNICTLEIYISNKVHCSIVKGPSIPRYHGKCWNGVFAPEFSVFSWIIQHIWRTLINVIVLQLSWKIKSKQRFSVKL